MNLLTEFSQRAPDSPWTTSQQLIAANDAALNMARELELLPTSDTIDVTGTSTEGAQSFDLITEATDFLKLDPNGGVHFYDGIDYKPLKSVTEWWMDNYISTWRDTTPEKPNVYWKKGKNLYIHPACAASYTAGIKFYYHAKPTAMTADGDDPFSDRTDLEDLHEGVVLYMLWKAKQALGEYAQAQVARTEYVDFIEKAKMWLYKDEEALGEPFRSYHKTPIIIRGDPTYWGNY